MHAVALRVLRTVKRPGFNQACRVIAGVRYPLPRRHFHRSAISYRASDDPTITENDKGEAGEVEGLKSSQDDAAQDVEHTNSSETKGKRTLRGRTNRQKLPEGLPPVVLPDWFWERNVKCLEDPVLGGTLGIHHSKATVVDEEPFDEWLKSQYADNGPYMTQVVDGVLQGAQEDPKYSINMVVYHEIVSSIRAGLTLRPSQGFSEKKSVPRPILHLKCVKDGGMFYLDSIVESTAKHLKADLVRLDPQDVSQILGPYLDENIGWNAASTSLLSYETSKLAGNIEEYSHSTSTAPDEANTMEDDDENMSLKPPGSLSSRAFRDSPAVRLPEDLGKKLSNIFSSSKIFALRSSDLGKRPGMPEFLNPSDAGASRQTQNNGTDQWNELKAMTLLESLVFAADSKRASDTKSSENNDTPRDLIIQVNDYKEMTKTTVGLEILEKLRTLVNKRWQLGRNIMIVGTSSSEQEEAFFYEPDIINLQHDIVDGEKRTIFVPTDIRDGQDIVFKSDDSSRTFDINVRHIQDMIRKLAGDAPIKIDLEPIPKYKDKLEEAVWPYAKVHRLATIILGYEKSLTVVDWSLFGKTLSLLECSDTVKFEWGTAEIKSEEADTKSNLDTYNESESEASKKPNTPQMMTKEKIKQMRKTCTSHEKKLLTGVILPADIHTTFSDVHAPKETVEALKTLTSLSLIRPEAFTYGVLATDKIPGLLLYGPPGTGKTLLAKAVAKESGATVLEVSGAEVNNMYVGEGEKNVRAVFSLAKKLSPCIVFIDEADAIFAARGNSRNSTAHRELINQFLREWDGMEDLSAFTMVATNRPFDLDEAVLRRLPRRLLVDLPVEKDREAILKIHLQDENLDSSVSVPDIAKNTPFYSGSDLKNLSVAAALACIREENEAAAKHEGDEPYVYPEKRTLTKVHFDKAIEEISASINEDMSSLRSIRKFDEKYGDRKGRRRKSNRLGFGGDRETEKDSDSGRVRKVTA